MTITRESLIVDCNHMLFINVKLLMIASANSKELENSLITGSHKCCYHLFWLLIAIGFIISYCTVYVVISLNSGCRLYAQLLSSIR